MGVLGSFFVGEPTKNGVLTKKYDGIMGNFMSNTHTYIYIYICIYIYIYNIYKCMYTPSMGFTVMGILYI